MPHRPKKKVKAEPKPQGPGAARNQQMGEQRRLDSATRSTLSRFQNRKSDIK